MNKWTARSGANRFFDPMETYCVGQIADLSGYARRIKR